MAKHHLKRRIECNNCNWWSEGEDDNQIFKALGKHVWAIHTARLYKISDTYRNGKLIDFSDKTAVYPTEKLKKSL